MKNTSGKIRLLVIEDNRILRDGIISILKPHTDIKLLSEPGKSKNTILKIHKLKPDIILLDLGLRSRNSLSLVEMVKKEFPESKVIVMDLVPVQGDIVQFVEAGASGFILKNTTTDEFLATIRAVAEGVKVLPVQLKDTLFSKIIQLAVKSGKAKLVNSIKMTKREKDILMLVSDGFTNTKISVKLHIPEHIVKSHIHNILEKLALRTRLEPAKNSSGLDIFKAFSK
jgi:DNA-binding NarL/FixJ family response regulator